MNDYDLNEVIEYLNDLEREWSSKDDLEAFNQAVMRLREAVNNLNCIDDFDDIEIT